MLTTPEYHHWHHTSDEEGIDKNFVSFLPLWDVLFGTAHQPDYWPKNYGTAKFQPPETYLGQLASPFRRKERRPPTDDPLTDKTITSWKANPVCELFSS